MKSQTFRTVLEATGGNNVAIVVPDAVVAAAWERLSASKQKAHALSIESAKTDDTRTRRLAKVMESLRG